MRLLSSILIVLLSSLAGIANDDLYNCMIDAIIEAKKHVEKDCLWRVTLIEQDTMEVNMWKALTGKDIDNSDSSAIKLDPKYYHLLPLPHKYYVDIADYKTKYAVSDNNYYPSISSEPEYKIPMQIKNEPELVLNNIFWVADNNPELQRANRIRRYGTEDDLHWRKIHPEALVEKLWINAVTLWGKCMNIEIAYRIDDECGNVMRGDVMYNFYYTLSKRNLWKRLNEYTRSTSNGFRTEYEVFKDVNTSNQTNRKIKFKPLREYYHVYNSIIPYSYVKFNNKLCEKRLMMPQDIKILNDGPEIDLPEAIFPEDYDYMSNNPVKYQGIDLIPYDKSYTYITNIITADLSCHEEDLNMLSQYVDNEFKYVFGKPMTTLVGDTIATNIVCYRVDKMSIANDTLKAHQPKFDHKKYRFLLIPAYGYTSKFAYNREKDDWLFTEDKITKLHSPQLYMEAE